MGHLIFPFFSGIVFYTFARYYVIMSNAGGSRVKPGAITGKVFLNGQVPGPEAAVFEPEAGMDFGAVGGFITGVVSSIAHGAGGTIGKVVSDAGRVAQGAITGGSSLVKSVTQQATRTVQAAVPKISVPKVEVPKIEIPKIEMPKISVPKIAMPTVSIPKIEIPKVDVSKSLVATGAGLGAALTGAVALPGVVSAITAPKVTTGATPGVSLPSVDVFGGLKCGIFGCNGQEGALQKIGDAGKSAANLLDKGLLDTITAGALKTTGNLLGEGKTGSDFLKSLPSLEDVQKATQSLAQTVKLAVASPVIAPIAASIAATDYVKNILSPKNEDITSPTKEPVLDTLEKRQAVLPKPGEVVDSSTLPEGVADPSHVWEYGESHTDVATCTIRRGNYIGFVRKYGYNETYPDECIPEGAVKYYTSLGSYKQKEMIGIPKYNADGSISMYDPGTNTLEETLGINELASGTVSVGKPETSLVYQNWATTPAVPMGGVSYDTKAANRFNISEFRDQYSDDLEQEVAKMNATKGADYASVNYSRVGAELYGGKVLPLDGRVLDPSLFTQETDFGKKIGLDFPLNNIEKVYGDLGQGALGEQVAPKAIQAMNAKGASVSPAAGAEPGLGGFFSEIATGISNLFGGKTSAVKEVPKGSITAPVEKAVASPNIETGTITGGFVKKAEVQCSEGDIICGVGKTLDAANPNNICSKDATNPLCAGFGAVENAAIQLAGGIGGAVPSLADLGYDTTTGAIEKLRGLDEGSLKRLGARTAWDNLFESGAQDLTGFKTDQRYYTKALGLDKQGEDEGLGTIGAKVGVGLFEDFLSHPVEWVVPEIMTAELVAGAPEMGEAVAGAVTGQQKTPVEYSTLLGTEKVSTGTGAPGTEIIDRIIYTDNPALDGKQIVTTSSVPPTT